MKTRLELYFVGLICVLCPVAARAQQYIYINNNLWPGTNSVTAVRVNKAGVVKKLHTYSTGGQGNGQAYPGEPAIASARTGSNHCLFVANGGDSTIAGFAINILDGSLTAVVGSPFPDGGSGLADVGLAVGANKILFAGSGNNLVSSLRINEDCSLSSPLYMQPALGPSGLMVTPNAKYLITTGLGPVDSFQINYRTGQLTELGPFSAQGTTMGVEVSCDSSTVYFGDAPSNETQIEVFSVSPTGELSEINNFIDHHGADSSSVLLSPDETTLYVGNNNSRQITALSVGPGGTLIYGSTTTLNGSSFELLGLAMGRSGAYLFGLEQYDPESLAVVAVNGITMTEVTGSPFPILHDPYDPGSLVAVPGKACR